MRAQNYNPLISDAIEMTALELGVQECEFFDTVRRLLSYEFRQIADHPQPMKGRALGQLAAYATAMSGAMVIRGQPFMPDEKPDVMGDPYDMARILADRLSVEPGDQITQKDAAHCVAVLENLAELNGTSLIYMMELRMRTERALRHMRDRSQDARAACEKH